MRGSAPTPYSPVIEFIPVPALPNEGGIRRRGDLGGNGQPRRLPPLRGGAGQELDLSDPRHCERVPADLRPRLPERGFVNLTEANAIVRLLETLVGGGWTSPLAVLPLFSAQAETIRYFAAPVAAACPNRRSGDNRAGQRLPPSRMRNGDRRPDAQPRPPRRDLRR